MTFQISDGTYVGKVVLKVNDLELMADYYENTMGLNRLSEKEGHSVDLGIAADKTVLITLEKLQAPARQHRTSGLYHLAFLLPERKDLGNVLKRFVRDETRIFGASDHGYSEAIYLYDPENNGIEIYVDKPKTFWDIKDDGSIEGITIQMDAQGVFDAADEVPDEKFPAGTIMGHVHLSVTNLEETEEFYSNVLGFGLKSRFGGQALFYAAGEYHHHIGNNVWQTSNAPEPQPEHRGMRYFEIIVPELTVMTEHFDDIDYTYEMINDKELTLKDPSGISMHILEKA